MKWVLFFLVAFVGIFVGLLFMTGVAQKHVLPLAQRELRKIGLFASADTAGADSSNAAVAGQPAAAGDSAAVAAAGSPGDSATAGARPAGAAARAASLANAAQRAAVARALPAPRTPEQQARDAVIAKVYAEMAPEEAVKVLKQLDDATALAIVSHLKADKAAKILEAMGPERSVKLTQMWSSLGTEGAATP